MARDRIPVESHMLADLLRDNAALARQQKKLEEAMLGIIMGCDTLNVRLNKFDDVLVRPDRKESSLEKAAARDMKQLAKEASDEDNLLALKEKLGYARWCHRVEMLEQLSEASKANGKAQGDNAQALKEKLGWDGVQFRLEQLEQLPARVERCELLREAHARKFSELDAQADGLQFVSEKHAAAISDLEIKNRARDEAVATLSSQCSTHPAMTELPTQLHEAARIARLNALEGSLLQALEAAKKQMATMQSLMGTLACSPTASTIAPADGRSPASLASPGSNASPGNASHVHPPVHVHPPSQTSQRSQPSSSTTSADHPLGHPAHPGQSASQPSPAGCAGRSATARASSVPVGPLAAMPPTQCTSLTQSVAEKGRQGQRGEKNGETLAVLLSGSSAYGMASLAALPTSACSAAASWRVPPHSPPTAQSPLAVHSLAVTMGAGSPRPEEAMCPASQRALVRQASAPGFWQCEQSPQTPGSTIGGYGPGIITALLPQPLLTGHGHLVQRRAFSTAIPQAREDSRAARSAAKLNCNTPVSPAQ